MKFAFQGKYFGLWFMNSIKIHAKLNKQQREYLRYNYRKRAKMLVANRDRGREYSPKDDEPVRINLEQKFSEFTAWLKEFVLDYILSFPEADIIQPPVAMEELIPYKTSREIVFSICNWRAAERIMREKN